MLQKTWRQTQSHTAAVSACVEAKQPRKAMGLLAELQQKGLAPFSYARSAAVSACVKDKQPHTAVVLIAEVQQKGLRQRHPFSTACDACE